MINPGSDNLYRQPFKVQRDIAPDKDLRHPHFWDPTLLECDHKIDSKCQASGIKAINPGFHL